jgi:solute carrier family 45, member 1/2/4
MEEKLHDYQGWGGRLHEVRDNVKNKYSTWREANPESGVELLKKKARELTVPANERTDLAGATGDYSHLYR